MIYITYSKRQNALSRVNSLETIVISNVMQLQGGESPELALVGCAESEDEYSKLMASLNVMIDVSIAGYATFTNDDGTTSHVPIAQQEADEILRCVDDAKTRRTAQMPDEQSAINTLFDAYQRLMELGWRDIAYCPKDDVVFDALELGSTGIHSCVCQDGDFWICGDRDTWPANPVLYREPKSSENLA